MAFWALVSGTVVGCGGTPLYGVPYDPDLHTFRCSCSMPCGEGTRDWETTIVDPDVDPAWYESVAQARCMGSSNDECTEPLIEDCTCTCEEVE